MFEIVKCPQSYCAFVNEFETQKSWFQALLNEKSCHIVIDYLNLQPDDEKHECRMIPTKCKHCSSELPKALMDAHMYSHMEKQMQLEPLYQKSNNRYTLFPIKYHKIFEIYKKMESTFWPSGDILRVFDDPKEIETWNQLSPNIREFLKKILAFFANSDGIVQENLAARFLNEFQVCEIISAYSYQIANESTHAETYGLLIDNYVRDEKEKAKLFNAVHHYESIKRKAKFAQRYIHESIDLAERLIAFLCFEGIHFSSSFCAIFWLKSRQINLQGMILSNEFIARDENQHCQLACEILKTLQKMPSEETVKKIFKEAVELEKFFVDDCLRVDLVGINANSMKQYVESVADFWLLNLGYSKMFHTLNPFPFMEAIQVAVKSNFFEKQDSNYSFANVTSQMNKKPEQQKKNIESTYSEEPDF